MNYQHWLADGQSARFLFELTIGVAYSNPSPPYNIACICVKNIHMQLVHVSFFMHNSKTRLDSMIFYVVKKSILILR